MVKRVGRDTAVRIDKRTATGIGCLVTIGIVLALMIVTFHAIARGDVPENPLTPVGVVLELVCARSSFLRYRAMAVRTFR